MWALDCMGLSTRHSSRYGACRGYKECAIKVAPIRLCLQRQQLGPVKAHSTVVGFVDTITSVEATKLQKQVASNGQHSDMQQAMTVSAAGANINNTAGNGKCDVVNEFQHSNEVLHELVNATMDILAPSTATSSKLEHLEQLPANAQPPNDHAAAARTPAEASHKHAGLDSHLSLTLAVDDMAKAVQTEHSLTHGLEQQTAMAIDTCSTGATVDSAADSAAAIMPDIPIIRVTTAAAPDGKRPKFWYMPHPMLCPVPGGPGYSEQGMKLLWATADKMTLEEKVKLAKEDTDRAIANTDKLTADAAADTPVAENAMAKASTQVQFSFRCKTEPGQRLWLTGDHPSLGAWDINQVVKLKWREGHVWSATVSIEQGASINYKAVLQHEDKQWQWQSGDNWTLIVQATDNRMQVTSCHAFT
eukprot:GHRR01001878.1.p1 GENE.GHRR01001878.1~~GHRR01001878.1.p1  ORF type:complete len:417 (+),score=109.12 GHRR01001878.1:142-1392(+)